uniref:Uncharacterized protein n=1 Tax=Gopherus evgoodei TaxID=1825980 RepID=A0A8C4VTL9_9SAUR
IRYGAWYLDPKTWRKQKVNEPLEDPKAAADAIQNLRKRFSEKVLQASLESLWPQSWITALQLTTVEAQQKDNCTNVLTPMIF